MTTTQKTRPVIAMTAIKSSQIEAIGHHPESNTLAIQFKGRGDAPGSIYHYDNFTVEHFAALQGAESIGSHFYKHIKPHSDKHPYTRIDALREPS